MEPDQTEHQLPGEFRLLVDGEPEAQAELGIVFKQRVRPGRSAAFGILGPGRGRQIAAVDRRAAGGVGDHRAVAEELRNQLQIRRFAASRAGAGEFKQRLLHLLLPDAWSA